ncbi:MAG TPA: DUF3168 domain-containing protein [Beijerinckiaceae bacterium]|jgi:hypothetical protein
MPVPSSLALRKAVFDRLVADAALLARLGAPRIYDGAPRGAATPYVVFAQTRARDWSTATERGDEHAVTLDVYSTQPGGREALEIAALVAAALDDAALALVDHQLVSLRVRDVEAQRESAGRFVRARLRLRALTERK